MTESSGAPANNDTGRTPVRPPSWVAKDAHFLAAVVLLLIVGLTIQAYGWIVKKPVVWPEGVEINDLHRNISLPTALPDESGYVVLKDDDPYYPPPGTEGMDGPDLVVKEDDLFVLGMRTRYYDDEQRIIDRNANWYGSRSYRYVKGYAHSPFLRWRLEVYYYTGLRDQVPHVPNACLNAGGATLISEDWVVFRAPGARAPWNEDLIFQRVFFSVRGNDGTESFGVTYYILGFNDEPISRKQSVDARRIVRSKMGSWDVYNYYVKIQFAPLGWSSDLGKEEYLDQATQAAQAFVEAFMPTILDQLPTKETVTELEKAERAKDD